MSESNSPRTNDLVFVPDGSAHTEDLSSFVVSDSGGVASLLDWGSLVSGDTVMVESVGDSETRVVPPKEWGATVSQMNADAASWTPQLKYHAVESVSDSSMSDVAVSGTSASDSTSVDVAEISDVLDLAALDSSAESASDMWKQSDFGRQVAQRVTEKTALGLRLRKEEKEEKRDLCFKPLMVNTWCAAIPHQPKRTTPIEKAKGVAAEVAAPPSTIVSYLKPDTLGSGPVITNDAVDGLLSQYTNVKPPSTKFSVGSVPVPDGPFPQHMDLEAFMAERPALSRVSPAAPVAPVVVPIGMPELSRRHAGRQTVTNPIARSFLESRPIQDQFQERATERLIVAQQHYTEANAGGMRPMPTGGLKTLPFKGLQIKRIEALESEVGALEAQIESMSDILEMETQAKEQAEYILELEIGTRAEEKAAHTKDEMDFALTIATMGKELDIVTAERDDLMECEDRTAKEVNELKETLARAEDHRNVSMDRVGKLEHEKRRCRRYRRQLRDLEGRVRRRKVSWATVKATLEVGVARGTWTMQEVGDLCREAAYISQLYE